MYFSTALPRPYERPIYSVRFFYFSSLHFFLFYCNYLSLTIFSSFFNFAFDKAKINTYHKNYFFCFIVTWIMSTACLETVVKICFQYLVNWLIFVLPRFLKKSWSSHNFWRNAGRLNCSVSLGCGGEFWWKFLT